MVNSKLEMLEGETAIGKKAHRKGEEEKGWFYKREKAKERGRKRIKTKQMEETKQKMKRWKR
jgi:hypothetical protein